MPALFVCSLGQLHSFVPCCAPAQAVFVEEGAGLCPLAMVLTGFWVSVLAYARMGFSWWFFASGAFAAAHHGPDRCAHGLA